MGLKIRRGFIRLIALAFLCVFSPYVSGCNAQAFTEAKPFKVGIALPLTGDAANFGASAKNGMLLAYEALPEMDRKRLKLIFEDDGFVPKQTVDVLRKLQAGEKIDVFVTAGSQTSKAVSPLAESAKLPTLAIASAPEVVAGRAYVVNFWVTPDQEAKAIVPEAERRGYKRIVRIATTHDFPACVIEAFDQHNRGRIKVVVDEEYPPEIKDFKTFIAKVKSLPAIDAVMPVLMPGQLGVFARQLREQGVNLPMFGFEFFEDPAEVQISKGAMIGAWYVNGSDASGQFMKRYFEKYPGQSLFAAANGHDIVLLLNAALRGASTPAELNRFLHTVVNFTGAMGTYSATGKNTFTLPAAVKVVTPTGFEQVSAAPAPSI